MDMIQGIKERRSIRRFKDMPVPRETLEEIVDVVSEKLLLHGFNSEKVIETYVK